MDSSGCRWRFAPVRRSSIPNLVANRSMALAPAEDEEIRPETAAALDHARASLARDEGIPHEEILREFGLSQ